MACLRLQGEHFNLTPHRVGLIPLAGYRLGPFPHKLIVYGILEFLQMPGG